MRNFNIIFAFLFFGMFSYFSQTDFYYFQNEKINFEISYKNIMIWCRKEFNINLLKSYTNTEVRVLGNNIIENSEVILLELEFVNNLNLAEYEKFVQNIYLDENIYYSAYGLVDKSSQKLKFFSNKFHVFIEKNEKDKINWLEKEYKVKLLSKTPFLNNWYTFETNKNSKFDCSSICKLLNENQTFKYAEPDLLYNYVFDCANDTYFGNQWYLNNTGQNSGTSGVDIKVCDAWNETMGNSDLITAVIDQGIELDHPDLVSNIYPTSYDAKNNSSPSVLRGKHGTSCAGLISAISNNSTGVSGVAPNSKLMSISLSFSSVPSESNEEIGRAIDFAANNGASIISNSYSGGSPSQIIIDAISNALLNGRNGLGCVVVFSSGNINSSTSSFPSNCNPQIINVGAIDRCGIRSGRIDIITNSCDPWSSNSNPASSYGSTLDIVAGGTSIYTTDLKGTDGYDNTNYTSDFGGTSAACPQVAGVAALILSVNPCLTQQAVHDIICFSGQKLSNYTFTPQTGTSRESLGSWNNEVGHGLVDANVCVNLAKELYIQFQTISASEDFNFSDILMGSNVTSYKQTGNAVINNNAVSTITAKNSITLKKGTLISRGTNVLLKINPDLACNYSNPIKMSSMSSEMTNFNESPEIEQNLSLQKFNFYPNPTNETLNIKINNKLSEKVKIEIYNVSGKMLSSNYLNFSENLTHSLNLNENNLNDSGIYFIKVSNSTFSDSYKIIKL
jgi:subtilisin family serine protease